MQSFVIGCMACRGFMEAQDADDGYGVQFGDQNMFGYKQQEWEKFATGTQLLEALGEKEVRGRLKAKEPPLLHEGAALECAERLLLHEQGFLTPEKLGASQGATIKQRLVALGFECDDEMTSLQCARRLLRLREVPLEELLDEEPAANANAHINADAEDNSEESLESRDFRSERKWHLHYNRKGCDSKHRVRRVPWSVGLWDTGSRSSRLARRLAKHNLAQLQTKPFQVRALGMLEH